MKFSFITSRSRQKEEHKKEKKPISTENTFTTSDVITDWCQISDIFSQNGFNNSSESNSYSI